MFARPWLVAPLQLSVFTSFNYLKEEEEQTIE